MVVLFGSIGVGLGTCPWTTRDCRCLSNSIVELVSSSSALFVLLCTRVFHLCFGHLVGLLGDPLNHLSRRIGDRHDWETFLVSVSAGS